MSETINSLDYFSSHWTVWRILGTAYKKIPISFRLPYLGYVAAMNIMMTFGYPFHLGMSVFQNANLSDDIKNLTIFVTCLACSVKFIWYSYNFDKVLKMERLLEQLDARVSGIAQRNIYSQMRTQLRLILLSFVCIYMPIGLFGELTFIFQKERGMIYPAWIPFDWANSTRNYYIAHVYQIMGLSYQLLQNYVNDCYPAVMLCLISGHIQMLYMRCEQIGVDEAVDAAAHEKELEACISDHKNLLELFSTLESFMSLPMFIQITVTALNVCISIAALLFFVTEPMGRIYYVFYGLAMPLQIFPTCYFGTDTEIWFGKLHYAAFSCNWMSQGRSFKKKLIFFVERSLKKTTAFAGGMMRIHIDTFFSVMKFTYSLFTIIIRMTK